MAARKPQTRTGLATLLLRGVVGNPMATIGGLMMTITAAAIMTNALALQSGRHPAPLFVGTRPTAPVDQMPQAVMPALRSSDGSSVGAVDHSLISDIQQGLKDFGYYKGDVDGLDGPQTSQAILAFERAFRLAPTGVPTNNVLLAIRSVRPKTSLNGAVPPETAPLAADPLPVGSLPATNGIPMPRPKPSANTDAPVTTDAALAAPAAQPVDIDGIGALIADVAPAAKRTVAPAVPQGATPAVATAPASAATPADAAADVNIARIQRSLSQQGFGPLAADGRMTPETREAIGQFEDYYGLPRTGTINEAFVAQLVKVGGLKAD